VQFFRPHRQYRSYEARVCIGKISLFVVPVFFHRQYANAYVPYGIVS
jgi:hypothetical protein